MLYYKWTIYIQPGSGDSSSRYQEEYMHQPVAAASRVGDSRHNLYEPLEGVIHVTTRRIFATK